MNGRTWLIQVRHRAVAEAQLDPSEVFWPPVRRHFDEIHRGDRVVLWMSGPGDDAGVYALGVVDGPLEDRWHLADYNDPAADEVLRPSVPVRYTHWFEEDHIPRSVLRADARLEKFSLLRFARQQNPFPMTDDEWSAVAERVPEWSRLDAPEIEYMVAIDLVTDATSLETATVELHSAITGHDWHKLGFDVMPVTHSERGWWDVWDAPAPAPPLGSRVVTWERRCAATTASAAWRKEFGALYRSADHLNEGTTCLHEPFAVGLPKPPTIAGH